MTPPRAITAFLLALALGAGGYAVWSYRSMTERVTALEQTASDYADLKTSLEDLKAEVIRRRASDQAIRDSRNNTTKAIQEAANADATTADYLAAPLPDGLRDAYLKARAAKRVAPTDNH
jgi:hypothetical protein